MIEIVYSNLFLKQAKHLPLKVRVKLARNLTLIQENPFHPLLHAKPLSGELAGLYSFRITRDWRVIFQFLAADRIKLVLVGNRKDIYH